MTPGSGGPADVSAGRVVPGVPDAGPALVGVDVGSSSVKVLVADLDGAPIALARRATPTRLLPGDGAEHPLAEVLTTVDEALADALAHARADRPHLRVGAIGIASFAEAGAAVDARGAPLTDVLAWFDQRPAEDAARLRDDIGPGTLFVRTGLRSEAKVTLAKLAWLRRTDPEAASRLAGWRFGADLLAQHWTGAVGTSVSLACRSMAWRLADGRWDDELLDLVGLVPASMPPVHPWTEAVGAWSADGPHVDGIAPGTPVAVAGHDHVVGAVGAGVVAPGTALDSLGTAEAILVVSNAPLLDDRLRAGGYSVGAHVVAGRYTVIGGIQTSGGFVDWFLGRLAGVAPDREGEERLRALDDLVASARSRPSEVIVQPTLRGRTAPDPDPTARATFAGIGPEVGLGDLAAATLDGLAFHARWLVEDLERCSGAPISRLRAIGGGTRNGRLVEAKVAANRVPIDVVTDADAVATGAALVGGVAARLIAPEAVLDRVVPVRPPVVVADAVRDAYEAGYRRWRAAVSSR